ncbi:MAG: DUF2723 domain-containing protein [Chloroflexi bacterium]|nr:DUF2723 domain-containing protein [Chloroflexota bacterium]
MPLFKLDQQGGTGLAVLLVVTALLYLATLDTGLALADLEGGDLITHQYAQVQARPSNAPGYPIYTMGGWLWFHGFRSLATDANPVPLLSSYSTLWALLALAALYLLLYRVTGRNLAITFSLCVFYAITYFFWFYSVTTEQYTSAVLQTVLMVLLVHLWDEAPRDRYLYALAFLMGLGLAHMVTVLFVAPGILLFVLTKQPALLKRWRLILQSFVVAMIPLVGYLFVYVRGAQHPEWWGVGEWPSTMAWFTSFVSTQQGRDELTWTLGPFTSEFPRLIWEEVSVLLLILGVAGWVLLGKRYLLLYGLTAAIYLVFSYIDRFGNWFQVIMPLYPLILVGAAVVLDRLWRRFPDRLWRATLLLLLLALIIPKFVDSYPRADQRDKLVDTGLEPGWAIVADSPPADAAIITSHEEKLALDYITGIWSVRSDIRAITTQQVAMSLAAGDKVLATTASAAYAAKETHLPLRYNSWSPNLLLAGTELPPVTQDFVTVAESLGDGLRLVGLTTTPAADEQGWDLSVALQAERVPEFDWSLSIRLLTENAEIAQLDHSAPAAGYTPTTSLHPGDIVVDAYHFDIPPDVVPQAIRLILYRQLADGSFENLVVKDITLSEGG